MDDDYGQGGMSDPDWERYRVRSRALNADAGLRPLGDPLTWGSDKVFTFVVPAAPSRVEFTDQILRVEPSDTYSRAWSLFGTVAMQPPLWAVAAADLSICLEATFGVGRTFLTALIDLRLLTTADLATYRPIIGSNATEMRAFSLPDDLIARSIAMRLRVEVTPLFPAPFVGSQLFVSAMLAPRAAGTGL